MQGLGSALGKPLCLPCLDTKTDAMRDLIGMSEADSGGATERRPGVKLAVLLLFATPVVLAICFAPVVAYLSFCRELEGQELMRAAEPLAGLPTSLGFILIVVLTWRLSARAGLSLADIGWVKPSAPDLAIGLLLGVGFAAVNTAWIFPALQASLPAFDPTLSSVPVFVVILTLCVSIVGEESVYRGFAFVVLERRFGLAVAVGVTTAFYALLAPGQGWLLNVWALGFGVVLCGVRHLRGSLVPCVLVHVFVSLAPRVLVILREAAIAL